MVYSISFTLVVIGVLGHMIYRLGQLCQLNVRKWQRYGVWEEINHTLRRETRVQEARHPEPTAAVVDSYGDKNNSKKGEVYGYDGGKKVKGRKRHILVDTQGLLLGVVVSEANMGERLGATALVMEQAKNIPDVELVWADSGYRGPKFAMVIADLISARVEIVKRNSQEFEVLPRRWVVERTFAWLVQNRRLAVDYEQLPEISEALIYTAMIRLMLRRLGTKNSGRS